jgi:hypothetical protein
MSGREQALLRMRAVEQIIRTRLQRNLEKRLGGLNPEARAALLDDEVRKALTEIEHPKLLNHPGWRYGEPLQGYERQEGAPPHFPGLTPDGFFPDSED